MSEECPLCGKPVVGRTALLGHLEFGHDVAEPGPYLEQLLAVDEPRRRRGPGVRSVVRRAGAALVVLALAGGAYVGYRTLIADSAADVAAAGTGNDRAEGSEQPAVADAPTTTEMPSTVAPSSTTAPPATTPPTSSTTTSSSTTTAPPTTTAPSTDLEFRKPFLIDASHDGCGVHDGQAEHEISFTFSGSRNITFDGVFHPDRSGDGPHTTTHAVPVGTKGYLDHVVVLDPAGEPHDVEISPPIYLGAC